MQGEGRDKKANGRRGERDRKGEGKELGDRARGRGRRIGAEREVVRVGVRRVGPLWSGWQVLSAGPTLFLKAADDSLKFFSKSDDTRFTFLGAIRAAFCTWVVCYARFLLRFHCEPMHYARMSNAMYRPPLKENTLQHEHAVSPKAPCPKQCAARR